MNGFWSGAVAGQPGVPVLEALSPDPYTLTASSTVSLKSGADIDVTGDNATIDRCELTSKVDVAAGVTGLALDDVVFLNSARTVMTFVDAPDATLTDCIIPVGSVITGTSLRDTPLGLTIGAVDYPIPYTHYNGTIDAELQGWLAGDTVAGTDVIWAYNNTGSGTLQARVSGGTWTNVTSGTTTFGDLPEYPADDSGFDLEVGLSGVAKQTVALVSAAPLMATPILSVDPDALLSTLGNAQTEYSLGGSYSNNLAVVVEFIDPDGEDVDPLNGGAWLACLVIANTSDTYNYARLYKDFNDLKISRTLHSNGSDGNDTRVDVEKNPLTVYPAGSTVVMAYRKTATDGIAFWCYDSGKAEDTGSIAKMNWIDPVSMVISGRYYAYQTAQGDGTYTLKKVRVWDMTDANAPDDAQLQSWCENGYSGP